MKLKKALKVLVITTLFFTIAGYIAYATCVVAETPSDLRCHEIELNIAENLHSGFITRNTIEKKLRDAAIFPVDRLMSDVSTRHIEKTLKEVEFVERVSCHKTTNGKLVINITQRTPVLYVLPSNGEKGYYVDTHGKIISKSSYPVNMPVATGDVTKRYASRNLCKLATFIVNDSFWNNQIEQLVVSLNSNGEYVVDIIPRVGQHIVHLGPTDNYEEKLSRLMTFYNQAMPKIGWNKYSEINLEYDGQILCKK